MIQLGLYNYKYRSLYEVVGVSEQAVSQHRKRQHIRVEQLLLISQLARAYREGHPGCGIHKLAKQIRVVGIGRDRTVQILKELGYKLPKKSRIARVTVPGSIRWPNLIEGMLVYRPNQIWQTDITYFKINGIHYYLIFIIDVYTKLIVSNEVSQTMHAYHNLRCLKRALKQRGIDSNTGLIHHSDRGAQYTSLEYMDTLNRYGIYCSMGLKGQDNAYAERVNGIIKNEYLQYRDINTFSQLKMWTKQAVDNYNLTRIHNALPGEMSPIEFEKELLTLDYQRGPKVIIYADGNKTIREDSVFLNQLPKKALQDPICPIIWND